MSSPEYAELRGISGNAVAAKAVLMAHPAKRGLLFFYQALSLDPGLRKATQDCLEMFADRIGTPTMHKAGMKPGQVYDCGTVQAIEREMAMEDAREDAIDEALSNMLADADRPQAVKAAKTLASEFVQVCRERFQADLPGFIIELCINPSLQFTVPGEREAAVDRERRALSEQLDHGADYMERRACKHNSAGLPYFRDIIGALFEYKRRFEEAARRDFVMTGLARQVFEVLDVSLFTGKMVVIQGESRIGKTTAAEAWYKLHQGEARFVSLSGISNRTGFFTAIGKSLGLAANGAYTATKLQVRVEAMLQRTKPVLVFDEAHYMLSATERTRCAPELIDWVNTALCNHGVPCALICTPQLINRMTRHEHQGGWNAQQWRGRVERFCVLDAMPSEEDLRAVACKLLPEGDKPSIKFIVGYALKCKLPMPALVNAVDEAKLIIRREGRDKVTYEDVKRAIVDYCSPSAAAMEKSFLDARRGRKRQVDSEPAPALGNGRAARPAEVEDTDLPGEGNRISRFDAELART